MPKTGDKGFLRFRKDLQTSSIANAAGTTFTLAANTLYSIPIFIPSTVLVNSLQIRVTTAATGYARVGLYSNKGCAPHKLLLDAGEVSVGSTGIKTLTVNQSLNKSLYWLALVCNATPALASLGLFTFPTFLGISSTLGTAWYTGYTRSYTYGSLPDPFGTGTLVTSAIIMIFANFQYPTRYTKNRDPDGSIFDYSVVGSYYSSSILCNALTTFGITANRLYGIPFILSKTSKFDRISINVTTSQSAKARLGVYASGTDRYPSSLILDAGEVDVSTTGVKEIEINLTLLPGLYYLAGVSGSNPTLRAATSTSLSNVLGSDGLSSVNSYVYRSFTYAALPNPFGTPSLSTGNAPCIFLRRAS